MGMRGTDYYLLIQTNACSGEGNLIHPLLELVGFWLCKGSLTWKI